MFSFGEELMWRENFYERDTDSDSDSDSVTHADV